MARTTGPTIARWQLGHQLRSMRLVASMTHSDAAEVLGCSESKIYKFEAGHTKVNKGDLMLLLDAYAGKGAESDGETRALLLELQKQGSQRGWWTRYGRFPERHAMYVGLESAATTVRAFALGVVPGLLQTEQYARAVIGGPRPDQPEETDRWLRLRMERQKVLTEDPPLVLWAIIDEGVLRRQVGGRQVLAAQLHHLVEAGQMPNVTVQVLPFEEDWHLGTQGSFDILEFPDDMHSPVVSVESLAGHAYLESEEEVQEATLGYTHMHAAALSAAKSRDLIAAIAREVAE